MTKSPFIAKVFRPKECLELVHIDVYEPFTIHAHRGYEYSITFTDYHSTYGYVYLMCRKSYALDKFKELKTESIWQLGESLKTL